MSKERALLLVVALTFYAISAVIAFTFAGAARDHADDVNQQTSRAVSAETNIEAQLGDRAHQEQTLRTKQSQLRAVEVSITHVCKTLVGATSEDDLLRLSQTISDSLPKGVAMVPFNLVTTMPPTRHNGTASPTPSPSPSPTTSPAAGATPPTSTAVTITAPLTTTLHGSNVDIMTGVNTIIHRLPTVAITLTEVTRSTNNDGTVDGKIVVTPDLLPAGSCTTPAPTAAMQGAQPVQGATQ
jgi:hypothetical protein